jgi:hypothetical protein
MTKAETIQQLSRPFSKEELRSRPGQGGATFVYADASAVIARLNEVLGGDWDFETKIVSPQPAIIEGTLTVRFPDGTVTRRVDYGYPNGERDQEPVKSAQSDALRRCARMIGVGLYLYSRTPNAKPSPRVPMASDKPVAAAPKPVEFIGGKTVKMVIEDIGLMNSELIIDYNIDLLPKITAALKKEGVSGLQDLPAEKIAAWYKRVQDYLADAKSGKMNAMSKAA